MVREPRSKMPAHLPKGGVRYSATLVYQEACEWVTEFSHEDFGERAFICSLRNISYLIFPLSYLPNILRLFFQLSQDSEGFHGTDIVGIKHSNIPNYLVLATL